MPASGGGPDAPHRPVLLGESLGLLEPRRGGLFVDATLGLGGHSEAILEASAETRVVGLDRDREALAFASERLSRFGSRFRAVHSDFREIARVLAQLGESEASGVLADLGVSSLQFDSPARGFSFRHDAPLDMRMDAEGDEETAAELLARLPEDEIARVIFEYGEERRSRRIARWIVERREQGRPVETTKELADLVTRAVGHKRTDRVHPATRTFQALRVAVNRELEGLDAFLETTVDLLQPGGRLAVISFHSLEDRVVKRTLRRLAGRCECDPRLPRCQCGARRAVEILTRRPVAPSGQELEENPRARSAKLRAAEKLGTQGS
ncbi:MAG TPA: 16S rRNA (cytosine(1402)-N(4))-methyltransferase RsmH [Pyrinomonadaceae bacterium]|nr:16S rRNA (cytosine(1402)-N(4))-methyltransferase RsmH [Pyrinomonadaceae bacterium]